MKALAAKPMSASGTVPARENESVTTNKKEK